MSHRPSAEQQRVKAAHTQRRDALGYSLDSQRATPSSTLSQVTVQRAFAPSDILQLQHTVGNQAVQRMLNARTKPLLQRSSEEGFDAGNDFENELSRTKGGGTPLPKHTKQEFEQSFCTIVHKIVLGC